VQKKKKKKKKKEEEEEEKKKNLTVNLHLLCLISLTIPAYSKEF
jgi:hypothetical protein